MHAHTQCTWNPHSPGRYVLFFMKEKLLPLLNSIFSHMIINILGYLLQAVLLFTKGDMTFLERFFFLACGLEDFKTKKLDPETLCQARLWCPQWSMLAFICICMMFLTCVDIYACLCIQIQEANIVCHNFYLCMCWCICLVVF